MNKFILRFKAGILLCLLAMVVGTMSFSVVSKATEAESSVAAIIVIDSYTVEGGPLEAGKDVTINLTLHNTSRNAAASSILMNVASGSGLIYPSYGNDNQFFIGTISAGGTETVSVPVSVSQTYNSEAVDLTCSFEYLSVGVRLSNSASIVIPSFSGGSVEVKSINVSSHATVYGDSLLSISYSNRTADKITDAEILVTGNVTNDSAVIKLDDIKPGKSYSEDHHITFTQPGDQEIEIVLTYTDNDGQKVETDLGKFSVEVEEEKTAVVNNENEEMILWSGRGIAAVGSIIALIAVIWYIKKR